LLKLISDEPRHGYELIKAIEELTGGEYSPSPGMVYPILTMLHDIGSIEEVQVEGSRKPFQITDMGRTHLEANEQEVDDLLEQLEELKPSGGHTAGPAIGRASKNLMTALSHRDGREGLDEELLLEIAGVLDEAAQKIERVR
jgi:DNA-binding PadR family transcriptional regulator